MAARHHPRRGDTARLAGSPGAPGHDDLEIGKPPARLRLLVVYVVALALRDAGVSPGDIARYVNLPEESMTSLLQLADAKLAALEPSPRATTCNQVG